MASVAELKKTVKGLVMPIPAVFDGKGEPEAKRDVQRNGDD